MPFDSVAIEADRSISGLKTVKPYPRTTAQTKG